MRRRVILDDGVTAVFDGVLTIVEMDEWWSREKNVNAMYQAICGFEA